MKYVGTFFSGCESDSFPLLSSDSVKLNICGERWTEEASHWMLQLICVPVCPSVSRRLSALLGFCSPQALCVCSPARRLLHGDLYRSAPLLPCPLHCPQEMQYSSLCRQQQWGWGELAPVPFRLSISVLFLVSLTLLPLLSAVKLLWTVEELLSRLLWFRFLLLLLIFTYMPTRTDSTD